jgi:hypothetical protein
MKILKKIEIKLNKNNVMITKFNKGNSIVPYFPVDNAHLMYTAHPVFSRSHELVV